MLRKFRKAVSLLESKRKVSLDRHTVDETSQSTLFVVSCSASKNPTHEVTKRWIDVADDVAYSHFQEFTPLRKRLLHFYSSIDSEEQSRRIYQGFKHENPDRWKKAWQTNIELDFSGASRAVRRYSGQLYRQLDDRVVQALADETTCNLLIISALHGPTLPSDQIPLYDLTMGDLWSDGVKLAAKWPLWIKQCSADQMKMFLDRFDAMQVMVGNEYKPTARSIREIAPHIRTYFESPSSGSQSSSVWGRELNMQLSHLLQED